MPWYSISAYPIYGMVCNTVSNNTNVIEYKEYLSLHSMCFRCNRLLIFSVWGWIKFWIPPGYQPRLAIYIILIYVVLSHFVCTRISSGTDIILSSISSYHILFYFVPSLEGSSPLFSSLGPGLPARIMQAQRTLVATILIQSSSHHNTNKT